MNKSKRTKNFRPKVKEREITKEIEMGEKRQKLLLKKDKDLQSPKSTQSGSRSLEAIS